MAAVWKAAIFCCQSVCAAEWKGTGAPSMRVLAVTLLVEQPHQSLVEYAFHGTGTDDGQASNCRWSDKDKC